MPLFSDVFNRYVHLTGCTKHKRPTSLSDDTPVLHLLSYSVDGKQGSDLLYCVIDDIVCVCVCLFLLLCAEAVSIGLCEEFITVFFLQINFLNQFLLTLLKTIEGTPTSESYFPQSTPKVHVMEITQHDMLVGRTKRCVCEESERERVILTHSSVLCHYSMHRAIDLLQLIHGNSILPLPTIHSSAEQRSSNLPAQLCSLIDLVHLQEDVLAFCIAGMPLIEQSSISSLRVPFKFKEEGGSVTSLERCV